MKPHGVQRAVRPQRFDRSAGDAPSLGRVERMRGAGMPKGEQRRRRRGETGRGDRERNKRTRMMLAWSSVFGVLALVALGAVIFLWVRQNMNRRASAAAGMEHSQVEKRVASVFQSPTEDEAVALVKRALALREPAGVEACFHPGAASPGEVIGFLRTMEAEDGPVDQLSWIGSMDANGLLIDGVMVNTRRDGRVRTRLGLMTPDGKGTWKLDFEAFARTVVPSWGGLLDGKAPEGVVRVVAAADTYYNGPFSDESQWVCYGMLSPDTEAILLGYCRKDSPQARAMKRILEADEAMPGVVPQGKPSKRVTLAIRRIEGAGERQFEISQVLAEDWVMAAEPYDTKFR